jgi:hypothetical protein
MGDQARLVPHRSVPDPLLCSACLTPLPSSGRTPSTTRFGDFSGLPINWPEPAGGCPGFC